MEKRTGSFSRNMKLEDALKEINGLLEAQECELLKEDIEEQPIIFIMGAPRSGTTLFFQWLAENGNFSYPTNFISRLYKAPIIAAKLQNILSNPELQFKDEFYDIKKTIDYTSENGKTRGVLSPNEFWYFWRRFLPFKDIDYLEDDKLFEEMNYNEFCKELWGISAVFQKPLVLKGSICNYNITFLNKIFKKAIFIHVKRSPEENMESLLEARKRQYGTEHIWYSTKIPEYNKLIHYKEPMIQIAGQIYHINSAIEKSMKELPDEKKLTVEYEKFCENPDAFFKSIVHKAKEQAWEYQFLESNVNKKFEIHHRNHNIEKNKLIYKNYIEGKYEDE